ncbi:hypothetical protein Pcar_3304 [Syntrophotalea carbinolica DSM 2380]|uniref:Uncharacterized protein n=1 Tax=Syntrophotalea carbinolica (strain DSM 2380 / NBRC 103641 / GraBd1) TaxID=338963 RepID=Q0C6L4_SYNC1|nr:hypothetical protein Pcar_3304 [Syntrophotalea carbinolica DSM 2380]
MPTNDTNRSTLRRRSLGYITPVSFELSGETAQVFYLFNDPLGEFTLLDEGPRSTSQKINRVPSSSTLD